MLENDPNILSECMKVRESFNKASRALLELKLKHNLDGAINEIVSLLTEIEQAMGELQASLQGPVIINIFLRGQAYGQTPFNQRLIDVLVALGGFVQSPQQIMKSDASLGGVNIDLKITWGGTVNLPSNMIILSPAFLDQAGQFVIIDGVQAWLDSAMDVNGALRV